jgi:sec-independent protein translocase protein TatA
MAARHVTRIIGLHMGSFSIWHWLVVLLVILLLFGGGSKISGLMGDPGQGIRQVVQKIHERREKDASMAADSAPPAPGTHPAGSIPGRLGGTTRRRTAPHPDGTTAPRRRQRPPLDGAACGVTRDEFLARFGTVFREPPDLAAELGSRPVSRGRRPGASSLRGGLAASARRPPATFLNGHPDLGRQDRRGPYYLTPTRQREQGLGRSRRPGHRRRNPPPDLTSAYRGRFGFPFIMAVKGKQPAEILTALEARLHNQAADERAEALRQVERILLLRLEDRLGEA